MLTIKCAKCKTKIMKYQKIGKGRVLRCWKSRIKRFYEAEIKDNDLRCGKCGNLIGEVSDNYVKMNRETFTYSGTKISG
ncbi:MAG TPA: hypothetical protein VKY40_05190 [Halanaerobiales bacterium]|nr:hypothetical protein [Halanaerobiales bacterium]